MSTPNKTVDFLDLTLYLFISQQFSLSKDEQIFPIAYYLILHPYLVSKCMQ